MSDALSVEVDESPGARTFVLAGELDMTTVDQVEDAVGRPEPGTRVLLDLRGLSFMDSCGVRMFLRLDKRARTQDWTLALVHGGGMIGRVIELCRIEERMEVTAG